MSNNTAGIRLLGHPSAVIPPIVVLDGKWNKDLDAAIVPTVRNDEFLAELHSPNALAVTTGQQPGLFTGPLYTVHKALAAAALSRRLAVEWGRPVVPIFWLAGDDHDYREASGTSWLDGAGRLDGWRLPDRAESAPQLPMSMELLPNSVAEGLDHLAATLPPGQHADATMAWLRRHYQGGATIHSAYAGALAALLAPYGVVCLDATHGSVKSAQRPILRQALEQARTLDDDLAALPDAGTGIGAGDGATLVFLETTGGRDRLMADGDGFRARRSGEQFTLAEILLLLEREPTRFSANVLLRPIVERAILPTVAYVAGPGEFRYLTEQASVLFPHFALTAPVPVPRWGGTVIEPWVERILGRLGVTAEQVMTDDGTLARAILRRDLPVTVTDSLTALRAQIDETEVILSEAGHALDQVLDRAVAGRVRKLTAVADDLERLFERHLRKRDDIAHAQWRRVADALRPGGVPQERRLSAATFLGRYGTSWLDELVVATDNWAAGWTP